MTRRRVFLTMLAALTALACHLVIMAGMARGESGDRKVFATGVGARALALGGAYTAIAADATAPVWNPAALDRAGSKQAALYATSFPVSGLSYAYAGYAHPTLNYGTFGFGAIRFSASGIEGRDARNFETGESIDDTQMRWLLAYGAPLTQDVSFGFGLKADTHALGDASATSFGADLGLLLRRDGFGARARSLSRFGAALRLENVIAPREKLGTQAVAEPRAIHVGVSYALPMTGSLGGVLALVEWVSEEGGENRVALGTELSASGLALRAGLGPDTWGAGAGVSLSGLAVDYAYAPGDLGASHRVSISHAFGATRDEMAAAARAREERDVNARLAQEIAARESERLGTLVAAGREHLDAGRFDEARDAFQGALLFLPDDAEVNALLLRAEREGLAAAARRHAAEGDTVTAVIAYRTALERNPDDPALRREFEELSARRSVASAAGAAARAREASGVEALAEGRYADAESLFAAILIERPGDEDARRFLQLARAELDREVALLVSQGTLLAERGLLDQGLAKWREALAHAPDHKELKKRISEAEKEKSRRGAPAAEPAAAVAVPASRPALSPAEAAEVADLYARGVSVFKAGRTSEAVEYWEIVWRRDPGHGDVRGYLTKGYIIQGMEHYTAGRLAEAIEIWQRALDVDPSDQKTLHYIERAGAELARTREITRR